MMKKPLVILAGPTAVGKTHLSVRLAKEISAEIISADSVQVYRHMDIGSAKITSQEMEGIPHHLVDVLEPEEKFNVVRFQEMAKEAARQIWSRGKIPLVVGGTGFYIQALLYDIDFTKRGGGDSFRNQLEATASEKGGQYLHRRLQQVDPEAARQIHPNNVKRIIRALEFYQETGEKISEHNEREKRKISPYNFAYFVLSEDRDSLYDRIDRRVDLMVGKGLADEVYTLRRRGIRPDTTAMQALGYKEMYGYFDGEYSMEEAVRIIKRDTRHFAKRQITWFKREKDVVWLHRCGEEKEEEKLISSMICTLKSRGIIP